MKGEIIACIVSFFLGVIITLVCSYPVTDTVTTLQEKCKQVVAEPGQDCEVKVIPKPDDNEEINVQNPE